MRNRCIFYILLVFFCLSISFKAYAIEGFPGSSWGELYWELPKKGNQQDLVLQGWIQQGVTLAKWDKINLNTYATLRYYWDSQEFDWYSKLAPGVGISVEIFHFKQFHIRTGAEYIWERHYRSGNEEQKVWLYTDWYGWWDLKKKY